MQKETEIRRNINNTIEVLAKSKIDANNIDEIEVSFDKIAELMEMSIYDVSDEWDKEKLRINGIIKTLEKEEAMPDQEPSIHSDYAIGLERANDRIQKMNNYFELYKIYLRTLSEKLIEAVKLMATKHSADHFVEKTEKMFERIADNQKHLNEGYINNFMSVFNEMRTDNKQQFKDMLRMYALNNEILEKFAEHRPESFPKKEVERILKEIEGLKRVEKIPEEKPNPVAEKPEEVEQPPEQEKEKKPEPKPKPKDGKTVCYHCKEKIEKDGLDWHMLKKHSGMKKKCPVCGKKFKEWSGYMDHMYEVHPR